MSKRNIGPSDFDPYRAEFSGCNCLTCRNVSYANSGHGNLREAAAVLLAELQAGTHKRVELAEHIAMLKIERAANIAEACLAGRSGLHMYGMHRGVHGGSMERHWYGEPYSADFMVGIGIGMTPGRHEAANARLIASRERKDREREAAAKRKAETDPRYTCTYFQVSGEFCAGHAELIGSASA